MKVLQIHNSYRHFGGEDVVVEMEKMLLNKCNDVDVLQVLFDNEELLFKDLFYNNASYKKIEKVILDWKPNIVHVHNLFYKATPSVLKCAKKYNIPVVMTLHNFRLICPNGLLLKNEKPCMECVNKSFPVNAVMSNCFQNSRSKTMALSASLFYHNKKHTWNNYVDKFLVLTPFAKQTILNSSLNISPNKVVVKPNSVDDFYFKPNHTKRKDYVFIGRLSNEKGPHVAVEAFKTLPGIKLHIIGEGPLEDSIKKQASHNIIFHGIKDKEFVVKMLRSSKALIFPSICFEGLPNTILEAYSTGTPVISSNIENISDIVENKITGLHFETNNSSSLKQKVQDFELCQNEDLYKNAREKYLENYTHKKNSLSLLKIYQNLIFNEKDKHT